MLQKERCNIPSQADEKMMERWWNDNGTI